MIDYKHYYLAIYYKTNRSVENYIDKISHNFEKYWNVSFTIALYINSNSNINDTVDDIVNFDIS
ncbi:MAG: hypothetical protein EOP33_01585 [Rickettsiaceae bacterium]|nr:MAG: hypothetical protein EOP33_01585 [Rickettsiaceae bacterium]